MKDIQFVTLRRMVKQELDTLPETSADLFRKGTLLMYVGQQMASLADYPIQPGSLEYRKVLSDLIALLEMPTIKLPEIIGNHISEPTNED